MGKLNKAEVIKNGNVNLENVSSGREYKSIGELLIPGATPPKTGQVVITNPVFLVKVHFDNSHEFLNDQDFNVKSQILGIYETSELANYAIKRLERTVKEIKENAPKDRHEFYRYVLSGGNLWAIKYSDCMISPYVIGTDMFGDIKENPPAGS